MKKNLLLIAAIAATMGANAQDATFCFADMTALGFDGSTVPAGTVICQDENGTVSTVNEDAAKAFVPSRAPYEYVAVAGGEAVKITSGATGNSNGQSPLSGGVATLPGSGWMFKLETTKSGYFYVLTKLNTNKNYYLMEGQSNLYAYRLGVVNEAINFEYTLPEDAFGNVDLQSTETKYFVGEPGAYTKLQVPYLVNDPEATENPGEGSGFLCFASYATADAPSTFYYWAQGSKMANNGFIFVADDEPLLENIPAITFSGIEKVAEDGTVTPAPTPVTFGGNGAGVGAIAADQKVLDENAPVYNVLGQKVTKEYKGILIQNGKKYINR